MLMTLLPRWRLSVGEWRYYGWRVGVQIGRVLVLVGRTKPEEPA